MLSFVSQNLDKTKFVPEMLIIGGDEDIAYDVSNIKVTYLNQDRVLTGAHLIFKHILKFRPDAVLSSVDHLNNMMGLMAPFFTKTKFIIRVASVLSEMRTFSKVGKLHGFLDHLSARTADGIICQSVDMAKDYANLHSGTANKIKVIGNPITLECQETPYEKKASNQREYITIGRLSPEKGHLRLLEVIKDIDHPFHYTIVGDGPQKQLIEQKVLELGLRQNITFVHFTKNISKYLLKCDYFLQGSFVEGFPNALLESCSLGIPVIAFDAPGGTKEIIQHNINGFLVENIDMFKKALTNTEKIWNRDRIKESVYSKFGKEQIIGQYESFISDVINP